MPLTKSQKRLKAIRRYYAKKKAASLPRVGPAESRIMSEVARTKAKLKKDRALLKKHRSENPNRVWGVPYISADCQTSDWFLPVRASSAEEAEAKAAKLFGEQNAKRDPSDRVYIDGDRAVIAEREFERWNDANGCYLDY
jgi:hypothetical protein